LVIRVGFDVHMTFKTTPTCAAQAPEQPARAPSGDRQHSEAPTPLALLDAGRFRGAPPQTVALIAADVSVYELLVLSAYEEAADFVTTLRS
jgi:hypothetical protein